MKKTVFVTGAAGAVGQVLVNQLVLSGYQVRALYRKSAGNVKIPESVEIHCGDITRKEDIKGLLDGVDTVFHLAAKLHVNQPDPSLEKEYYHVNVEGTRNLVDEALCSNVKRFVFFSTISVYGDLAGNKVASEETSPNPQSFYAKTKLLAEGIVLSARRKERPESPFGVVLRLAAVYGRHMKGNYLTLASAIQKGWFFPVGKGKNSRTVIYEKDVAKAAIFLSEHPDASGQVFNVTDGDIHALNDILEKIYRAFGKKKPAGHVPVLPLKIIAGLLDPIIYLSTGKKVISHTVDKLVENVAVSGRKLQNELAFQPDYSLEAGWKETVNELSHSGHISN